MKSEEQRLRREIKRITALARQQDKAEDQEFGPDFRGDELPEELARRETRRMPSGRPGGGWRKLKTKRGRARYKLRKAIVEPVFGWVKHVIGFRGFSLRGHAAASAEWDLMCLALNLRRMNALMRWT